MFDDGLVRVAPLLAMVGSWEALLNSALPAEQLSELRAHARTGRPLGDRAFLDRLETLLERVLKHQKRGRPRKER